MKYGLLSYSTRNIGDEIQSLAARRFLPSVDLHIDRDFLNCVEESEPFKIILNGWFTHRPENWPPAPTIRPLFISFHITREIFPRNVNKLRASDHLIHGASLEYLRSYQPIGCRDIATAELLDAHGVAAYVSGCLTLTLENRWSRRSELIYCVDVSESVARFVAERVGGPVVSQTHGVALTESVEARFRRAEMHLKQYATAKLVVTSRLHCALPCLALATPLIFVVEDPSNYRLRGLCDLTRHYTEDQILSGAADVDWQNPGPNPIGITDLRRDLIKRCKCFVRT